MKYVIQWNEVANGQNDEFCVDNSSGDINEDFNVDISDILILVNIMLGVEQICLSRNPLLTAIVMVI